MASRRANLAWLLVGAAERHSGRHAFVQGQSAVTWAEVRARAATVASMLQSRGVEPGDRVATLVSQGADAAAAIFGGLAAGAIVVPLNEAYRAPQVDHALADCAVRCLVTTTNLVEALGPGRIGPTDQLRLDEVAPAPVPGDLEPADRAAGDPALILYTSGSTGRPRGVVHSHGGLGWAARTITGYLGLTAEDRIAALLPFSFVYGLSQLLSALCTGARLVVARSPLAQDWVAALDQAGVTVLAGVPPIWAQILKVAVPNGELLSKLRVLTNAGGALPVEHVRLIRQRFPEARLFLMYGLTEVFRSTFLAPEEVGRRPSSIGRAVPGSEVRILRDDGTPCGPDEVGEIVHRGPSVALGYWNDPEGTALVFRPVPWPTPDAAAGERVVFSGDLGKRDDEGFLYHVGRRDRQLKTLGYRLSPEEVAFALVSSGHAAEAVVTGVPDPVRGTALVAHVVLAGGSTLDELRAAAGRDLPSYMQPVRYRVWPDLPRGPTGKYDLAVLDEPGPAGLGREGRREAK